MEDNKNKLLEIKKKLSNYKIFMNEYGYNGDSDIFIKESLDDFFNILDEIEKKIKDEK